MGKSNHFRKTNFSRMSGKLLLLLSPLIFHLASGTPFSSPNFDRNNGNGLLRSLVKGIFYPVVNNHSSPFQPAKINRGQEMVISEEIQNHEGLKAKAKPLEDEEILATTTELFQEEIPEDEQNQDQDQDSGDQARIHVDIEIDKSLLPQLPELEEEEIFDPETNKTKRSKAHIRRLLQKLGILRAPKTIDKEAEKELESQMDEGSESESADSPQTTPAGSSILSKLNPINKIRYKINTARNVVNRALGIVGLGGGGEKKEGSEGEAGEAGDMGTPRDTVATDESSSGSSNSLFQGTSYQYPGLILGIGLIQLFAGSVGFVL